MVTLTTLVFIKEFSKLFVQSGIVSILTLFFNLYFLKYKMEFLHGLA